MTSRPTIFEHLTFSIHLMTLSRVDLNIQKACLTKLRVFLLIALIADCRLSNQQNHWQLPNQRLLNTLTFSIHLIKLSTVVSMKPQVSKPWHNLMILTQNHDIMSWFWNFGFSSKSPVLNVVRCMENVRVWKNVCCEVMGVFVGCVTCWLSSITSQPTTFEQSNLLHTRYKIE